MAKYLDDIPNHIQTLEESLTPSERDMPFVQPFLDLYSRFLNHPIGEFIIRAYFNASFSRTSEHGQEAICDFAVDKHSSAIGKNKLKAAFQTSLDFLSVLADVHFANVFPRTAISECPPGYLIWPGRSHIRIPIPRRLPRLSRD